MWAVPEHEIRVETSVEDHGFGIGEGGGVLVGEGKVEEYDGSWGGVGGGGGLRSGLRG